MNVIMNAQGNILEICRDLAGYCRQSLDKILLVTLNNRPVPAALVSQIDQMPSQAFLLPANSIQFNARGFLSSLRVHDAYIIVSDEPDLAYDLVANELYAALKTGNMLRKLPYGLFRSERHK